MLCCGCGAKAFTIRGLCAACDPQSHADHATMMDFIGEADDAFKAKTGKTALEDWHGFEGFAEDFARDRPDVLDALTREAGLRQ